MNIEKLKQFLNENDTFCKVNSVQLTRVEPGYAEAEMAVSSSHLNGRKVVQGGAIMTLADFAFAGAANATGMQTVSLNVNTSFIRPGTGKLLRAVARKTSQGRTTSVYNVEVYGEDGKLVAVVNITGYIIGEWGEFD